MQAYRPHRLRLAAVLVALAGHLALGLVVAQQFLAHQWPTTLTLIDFGLFAVAAAAFLGWLHGAEQNRRLLRLAPPLLRAGRRVWLVEQLVATPLFVAIVARLVFADNDRLWGALPLMMLGGVLSGGVHVAACAHALVIAFDVKQRQDEEHRDFELRRNVPGPGGDRLR